MTAFDPEKVRAYLEEQDRLIAIDEAVIDELRALVDERERTLARIRSQRAAMEAQAFPATTTKDGENG